MALPLSYNWRNLFVRKLSTTLTFTVIAVVVFVLVVLLAFAMGIRSSITATGSPLNLMVLKPGATSESTSFIVREEQARLSQVPGTARTPTGDPMISPEFCQQTSIPRRTDGNPANVAVRGVDDIAFQVHPDVKLIEGRLFEQGQLQVIVGKAAHDRYRGLDVGDTLMVGRQSSHGFEVVGIFEAGGGALESEVWAPRTMLMDAYNRHFTSSVVVRLTSPDRADEALDYVKSPSVGLLAKTETKYYEDLTRTTAQIVGLTIVLIGIMGIGAIFAVANTMYAAVDSRRREIAMLRTLGFSRAAVMIAFVVESLLISLAACAVGIAAGVIVANSWTRQDFLSDQTWTVLAFELKVTREVILTAVLLSVAVGMFGALAPAVRAARTSILVALRKA